MSVECCYKLKCTLKEISELGKRLVGNEEEEGLLPYEEFSEVFQVFSDVFAKSGPGKSVKSDSAGVKNEDSVYSQFAKPLHKVLYLLSDLCSSLQEENAQLSQFELNLTKCTKILQKTIKVNKLEKSLYSDSTNSNSTNWKNSENIKARDSFTHSLKSCELHFSSLLASTSLKVLSKIDRFSDQLNSCFACFTRILKSDEFGLLKKLNEYRKNFKVRSEFVESDNFLILALAGMLDEQVRLCQVPGVEVKVLRSFSETSEELLMKNFQLKSEIVQYESDSVKLRMVENELRLAKEKIELLDKVNKELVIKKSDSDDSLDLGVCDIKGAIELQDLRAALHSVTEKYEQEKEILIRDMIESRQDMETQLFRAQNEKNFIESNLKTSEKVIQDLQREKERQDTQISSLKKDLDRLKDLQTPENSGKLLSLRRRSSEFTFSPSFDFDISESIKSNPTCICEKIPKDLTEILSQLQAPVTSPNPELDWDSIKSSLKTLINLKKLTENFDSSTKPLELDQQVSKQFELHKSKIEELQQKIQSLQTTHKKTEDKQHRNHYVATEPSPRRGSPVNETVNQLQLEKSKLSSKKHEIHLHKEQIVALKKHIRDLQAEVEKARKFDLGYVREMWVGFAKGVSVQSNSVEGLMEVFMKALGFNSADVKVLQNERRSKKRARFGIF